MPLPFLCGRPRRNVIERLPSDIAATPDDRLFNLLNLQPWEPIDRQMYDDKALRDRITECPEGVAAKYNFSGGRGRPVYRTPMFKAVSLGASLETVQLMYQIYPPGIRDTGQHRITPLHTGCAYQASVEVIEFLLKTYPEAAAIKNKSGYTPLHNICEYGASDPRAVELLIEAYPEALVEKNKLGRNPYQSALQNPDPDPRVLRLLQKFTKLDGASTDPTSSLEFRR